MRFDWTIEGWWGGIINVTRAVGGAEDVGQGWGGC